MQNLAVCFANGIVHVMRYVSSWIGFRFAITLTEHFIWEGSIEKAAHDF